VCLLNGRLLTAEVISLRSRLKKISEPPSSMTDEQFIDYCFSMRRREVDELKTRSETQKDFSDLVHYIGRLGATRSSVNKVVKAVVMVPALRRILAIRIIAAPEPKTLVVFPEIVSPYELVWKIWKDSKSRNPNEIRDALYAFVELDVKKDDEYENLWLFERVL
jgi:hypothetical protein